MREFARAAPPGGSPAALAPLRQLGTLRAQGGVVPVPGVDDGVIAVDAEDAVLHIVDERGEVLWTGRLAHAAGEQAVAAEDVHHTGVGVLPGQGDRARGEEYTRKGSTDDCRADRLYKQINRTN